MVVGFNNTTPSQAQQGSTTLQVVFDPPVSADNTEIATTFEADFDATIENIRVVVEFSKEPDEICNGIVDEGTSGFPGEIGIWLISPAGTRVDLIYNGSNGSPDTYTSSGPTAIPSVTVEFTDAAPTKIGGPGPVSGTFRPEEALSAFNGKNIRGTWTVVVNDNSDADALCLWSLTLGLNDSFFVPNLGLVLADSAVIAYDSPGGNPVQLSNGSTLVLPADADRNGFDTYTVTGTQLIGDEQWIGIFLGDQRFAWIQLEDVTLIQGTLTFQ